MHLPKGINTSNNHACPTHACTNQIHHVAREPRQGEPRAAAACAVGGGLRGPWRRHPGGHLCLVGAAHRILRQLW